MPDQYIAFWNHWLVLAFVVIWGALVTSGVTLFMLDGLYRQLWPDGFWGTP